MAVKTHSDKGIFHHKDLEPPVAETVAANEPSKPMYQVIELLPDPKVATKALVEASENGYGLEQVYVIHSPSGASNAYAVLRSTS